MKFLTLILLLPLLQGCVSWLQRQPEPLTLSSLPSRESEVEVVPVEALTPERVMDDYRALLQQSAPPELTHEATRRLADLQLGQGERRLAGEAQGLPAEAVFDSAIKLYRQLLELNDDITGRDRLYYQLARAEVLVGRLEASQQTLDRLVREHPESLYFQEAQFRRGEWLFTRADYAAAQRAYAAAVAAGGDSPFHQRALFKLGWALFKQQQFNAALDAFVALLDLRADTLSRLDSNTLIPSDRELMQDTLRVTSLCFTQQGGAAGIDRYFQSNGERPWLHRVYRSLGDLYLKQERILDGADAYLSFVRRSPSHPQAPSLQLLAIESYQTHDFPGQALAAKRELAQRYSQDGEAWKGLEQESRIALTPHLRKYLRDLASHYHALAQQPGKVKKGQRDTWFSEAVVWYRHYLSRFPGEAQSGRVNFLLAELQFERGEFGQAVVEYQRTAYDYPPHKDAAEAGYAALLAFDRQKSLLPETPRLEWQRQAAESGLRFADRFPADKRTAGVLSRSARQLFQLGDYVQARKVAQRSLEGKNGLDEKGQRVSWAVAAHAAFELADYAEAETGYNKLLQLSAGDKAGQGTIREKLAAAIYQQGRILSEKGEAAAAAQHYLRVGRVVPDASIRTTAEYDGAASLITAGRWKMAAEVLEGFRQRYPKHELTVDVERKLALAYLQNDQPLEAAVVFERVAVAPLATEVQQQAAWQAAELYQKAGSDKRAVSAFKRYVKRFPQPLEPAMEARQQLVELYQRQQEPAKRDYWLRQIVAVERKAGAAGSERSRYLAAQAALRLAEPEYMAFVKIPLKRPLARSLKRKKRQMQRAIKAYDLAAGFAQADVTTLATFRLAEIYRLFGESLLTSERPAGLSAEELEQYELLLEEQAYPFEEKAIEAHELNARRAAQGVYDDWVRQSFSQLAQLNPARYAKQEQGERVFNEIR